MLLNPFKEFLRRAAIRNCSHLEGADIRAILDGDRESRNIDRGLMETIKNSINMYPTFGMLSGSTVLFFLHFGWEIIFIYTAVSFLSIRFFTKKAMRKWLGELLAEAEEAQKNKLAMSLYTKRFPVYIDLEMLSDPRQEEFK